METEAVDRMDRLQAGRGGRELAPQVLDMAVDRAVGHVEAVLARQVEQLGARKHLAGMARHRASRIAYSLGVRSSGCRAR
jgi:hypothetical protein